MSKSDFLQWFKERGFFYQCTDEAQLDNAFSAKKIPAAYIGFDCTAPSLHVGSLIQIMILRKLQLSGIKPIVLLGGATTKIGDPSGRDETRQLKTDDEIQANKDGILRVLKQFISFGDGKEDALLIDNQAWFANQGYIEFLRDVGRHFSVNRMLTFESVKQRLDREQNLSFLEFNYLLLQAYDFVHLSKHHQCLLQIGGSDQWGNIVSGVELARRMGVKSELFGLTTPLLTTHSGQKMGKTASGAIWLDAASLPVYDYWQFWRNTEDADVIKFLRLFTDLPEQEIKALEELEGADINQAKIILANKATSLCHGEQAAQQAYQTASQTFGGSGKSDGLPTFTFARDALEKGMVAYKLLVLCELVQSGGEAKRLIKGGGAKLNDQTITDAEQVISIKHLDAEHTLKLSAGKKKHALVKVSS